MLGHHFLDSYLHIVFLMILFYDCLEMVFGTGDKEDPPSKELKKAKRYLSELKQKVNKKLKYKLLPYEIATQRVMHVYVFLKLDFMSICYLIKAVELVSCNLLCYFQVLKE